MKSDIFKIDVTACPDDDLDAIDGEQMLTLYRALVSQYPDAEITVGISGSYLNAVAAKMNGESNNENFSETH